MPVSLLARRLGDLCRDQRTLGEGIGISIIN